MLFLGKFCLVAVATGAADWCWTMYFIKTSERKAVQAAFWSTAIVVVGAFTIFSYVHDWRLIFASATGAFVGTFLAVRYGAKS